MSLVPTANFPLGSLPEVDGIIVSYSGGKDSICLLDLCVRRYKQVVPFYRPFMKELDYTRAVVGFVKQRYGLDVVLVPDPVYLLYIRDGIFRRFPRPDLKVPKHSEIEDYMRATTGLDWIAYGFRAQESLERNAMLKRDWPYGLYSKGLKCAPIHGWTPKHVKAYMQWRNLPLPPSHTEKWNDRSGVGIKPDEAAWTAKYWPEDWKRICRAFPLAAGQVQQFYNLKDAELERRERLKARRKAEKEGSDGKA